MQVRRTEASGGRAEPWFTQRREDAKPFLAGGGTGLEQPRDADFGEAVGMERQGLLVIFGRLDGAGGALDPEPDEGGGGDRPGADRAIPAEHVVVVARSGALPVQWR